MAIVRYGGMPAQYAPSVGKQLESKWANTLLYDVPKGIAIGALKFPLGGDGESIASMLSPQKAGTQAMLQKTLAGMPASKLQQLMGAFDDETRQVLLQALQPTP
tara:strand:- start:4354 stop:4665 length:312 start_codon:yes stop_codon:yes gene_type:complete